MFHHALVSPDFKGDAEDSNYEETTNRNNAAVILDNQAVDMVINGHNHGFEYKYVDNTNIASLNNGFHQLITAGAGGNLYQAGQYYNFILVHVDGEEMTYTVVPRDEFYISKQVTNENDGTENSSNIVVYNDDDTTDWDWLRLKFKVSSDIENVYAYDQNGNYLELQNQLFDDYQVAYVETDIAAGSSKSITVEASNKIHEGTTNSIYSDGEVAYEDMPSDGTTEINIQATPSKDNLNLDIVEWETNNNYYKKWQAKSTKKNNTTSYVISDLATDYLYSVKVDGKLYNKYYSNDDGEIEFEYTQGKKNKKTFEVEQLPTLYAEDILAMPASEGGPMVRMLNEEGKVLSQFYAYNKSLQGGFKSLWADVNGDRKQEIIVYSTNGASDKIKVFNSNGELLAEKKVSKRDLLVKAGDIDNNGKDEIIVSMTENSDNKIKIYRYNSKKGKLKLAAQKRVYKSSFSGGVNIEVANLNSTDKEEIVVAPYSENNKLKIYNFKKGKVKLVSQKKFKYNGINLATGNVNKKGRTELIVAPKDDNTVKVYKLKNNKKLKLFKKKRVFAKDYADGFDVVSGDITGNYKDELILASKDTVKIFKYKKNKFELLKSFKPYDGGYDQGINLGLFDVNDNWDLELITAPKTGKSNVRVYDYKDGEVSLDGWFWGFSSNFQGGVNL